jgi:serine/threonine protein kinase
VLARYREPVDGTPFGRYRLIELLGRGGMGEVWRAYDTAIDRVVALKMLLSNFAEDPEFEQRFRREARAAARLDDPHVVPIYDVGEIDDRLYVTMRLITGTDLQTLLNAGPLDPLRSVAIIEQIASALHAAHSTGLVHRDVKPSNILLDRNDFAYLIDFGIARTAQDTRLTSAGAAIGTWAYMAPERFSTGESQPSSDIYALACVLYECLTGEQPFPGSTLEQVAVGHMVGPPPRPSQHAGIPATLDQVIATGLAKQPTDRYPSTVEMASAARKAVTESTSWPASTPPRPPAPPTASVSSYSAPPPPPTYPPYTAPKDFSGSHPNLPIAPPPPKRVGRRRGLIIGAAVFVVALLAAGGVAAVVGLTRHDDHAATAPSSAAAASGADFSGAYRSDYGPASDLEDKPVPNAPATTTSWDVRSTCGASGCVATAASTSGSVMLSNMTFDRLGGAWVAVGLATAPCGGDAPTEVWVVLTLTPQPDGTLTGESLRAAANGGCAAKRVVKFTRTGDPDLNKVPDPAVLPPRTLTVADGLHGRYQQTTTFTNGNVVSGKPLTANTYCLRTGGRCMSLFHGPDGAATLMFANDKWTRNEDGTAACAAGGTVNVTITADYPMPAEVDNPIALLTGHGRQTVAAGGACTGGGDFQDKFERTGD